MQLRFLRRKQPRRAVHSTARNAVLVPISQGTEVTIVTEYVPFRDYTRTASRDAVWETVQSRRAIMRNDSIQDSRGIRTGESVEYTEHRVRLEGHPWLGCRPIRILGVYIVYGQTKQRRGLNNVGQVNPEDCYLSRKDSGLHCREIQVVKPYKCGQRGPAGRLTNV